MYTIDKELSKRMNVMKTVLIILVVVVHNASFSNAEQIDYTNIFDIINYLTLGLTFRFAIPLFFLISSLFLYKKEFTWLSNIKKKIRSVLVPYLLCTTIWIALLFIMQSFGPTKQYFSSSENMISSFGFKDWIDAYFGAFDRAPYPIIYPFWFFRDLFLLNVCSILIKKLVDKLPIITLIALAVLWFGPFSLPGMFVVSKAPITFFILGYYIVKYNLSIKSIDNIKWSVLNILMIVLLIPSALFVEETSFLRNVVILVSGIYFIKLSKNISDSKPIVKFLAKIAPYSLIIYEFHEMTLTIFKKIVNKVLPQNTLVHGIEIIMIPAIIILLCVLFGMLLKKFLPKLFSLMTGGRS